MRHRVYVYFYEVWDEMKVLMVGSKRDIQS